MDAPFVLTWTPRIDAPAAALAFDYRLENRGPADAWALDELMVFEGDGFGIDGQAAIVREDDAQAGRVLLTRGYVQPTRSLQAIELRPLARRLAAGTFVEGRGRVPWPLQRWHPNEGASSLRRPAQEAVLEVGILPGHQVLQELPLVGGGVAQVPRFADAYQLQTLIRAAILSLPPPPSQA